jgi:hypothetical protein
MERKWGAGWLTKERLGDCDEFEYRSVEKGDELDDHMGSRSS